MKRVIIKIRNGLIEEIFAEEQLEIIILNVDGGYDDEKVVIEQEEYFKEHQYAEVDLEKIRFWGGEIFLAEEE